jgi:hypothetical protein
VLSLVFTIRFLATDLLKSHRNFKYHCNYSICTVFISHTKSSWQSNFFEWRLSESESYVTIDGPSASLSWNKAPIWSLRSHFYYCQTVVGLLIWGVLSDERTGLSFTIAAGPRQGSHSRSESRGTLWRLWLCYITPVGPYHRNTFVAYQWIFIIVAFCCTHYLATGCLPRICLRRKVFVELLPRNGSIRHNTLKCS